MDPTTDLFAGESSIAGRGVFTRVPRSKGEVVEVCPMMVLPGDQLPLIDETVLYGYYFDWDGTDGALALGLGSLYNHDPTGNVTWELDQEEEVLRIIAVRDIAPGEELTVDYSNGGTTELWFDPIQG